MKCENLRFEGEGMGERVQKWRKRENWGKDREKLRVSIE